MSLVAKGYLLQIVLPSMHILQWLSLSRFLRGSRPLWDQRRWQSPAYDLLSYVVVARQCPSCCSQNEPGSHPSVTDVEAC